MRIKDFLTKKNWGVAVLFILSIYCLLMDLIYQGNIGWDILVNVCCRTQELLTDIGFERERALELLKGSLGMSVTMITFILNLGIILFNYSERKVFGISWGDLKSDAYRIPRRLFRIPGFLFPFIVVVAINLEFCGTSYVLLACCYYVIYCRYRDLSVTYDKALQREKVIQKLTSYIEGDKEWINDNVTHFCAALENVRKGILNLEGWNNAWPLFDAFLRDIMKFDHDKCFVISGYFFEVIFDVSSKENIREETFFMKRYIDRLGIVNTLKEDIVLWSMLCSIAMQLDARSMETFLEWFTDYSGRSSQRILQKMEGLDPSEMQKQSAVILIMLEYWMYRYGIPESINIDRLEIIYRHGKRFLEEDTDNNQKLLQILDNMYEKKYCRSEDRIYNAAKTLYHDVIYQLNNTMVMTILKYNLWET